MNRKKTAFYADLRDSHFKYLEGAVYVCGHYGQPVIRQFRGAGPSRTPYKFKAIMRKGRLYIPGGPDDRDDRRAIPQERFPMVEADVQPQAHHLEWWTKESATERLHALEAKDRLGYKETEQYYQLRDFLKRWPGPYRDPDRKPAIPYKFIAYDDDLNEVVIARARLVHENSLIRRFYDEAIKYFGQGNWEKVPSNDQSLDNLLGFYIREKGDSGRTLEVRYNG